MLEPEKGHANHVHCGARHLRSKATTPWSAQARITGRCPIESTYNSRDWLMQDNVSSRALLLVAFLGY